MKKILVGIVLCSLLIGITAFTFSNQNENHSYINLTQTGYVILKSGNSVGYEKIEVKGEMDKSTHDFSRILKMVADMEKEGWVVTNNDFSSGATGIYMNFVLKK